MLGLIALSLTACATPLTKSNVASDLPDASLVVDCDTTEQGIATNLDMSDELSRTREQRDECAAHMKAVAQWRQDAVKRAAEANKH